MAGGVALFFHFFTIQWTTAPVDLKGIAADNVYVINLDRTLERHLPLKAQLDRLGLPFTRWSATDGYEVRVTDAAGHVFTGRDVKEGRAKFIPGDLYAIEDKGKSLSCQPYDVMSAGEVGCVLSHQRIWQHMVDEQIPWAIIFEDDIGLQVDHFHHELEEILTHLPAQWDLIYLSHPLDDPKKTLSTIVGNPTLKKIEADRRDVGRTHAYMLSQEGAQKLLAYHSVICFPSDGVLSQDINLKRINAYVNRTPIVTLRPTVSTLDAMGRGGEKRP